MFTSLDNNIVSKTFYNFQVNHTEAQKPVLPTSSNEVDEVALREKFIKKQKELLDLQQRKIELELLQTKNQLELQKKRAIMNKNIAKVYICILILKFYYLIFYNFL